MSNSFVLLWIIYISLELTLCIVWRTNSSMESYIPHDLSWDHAARWLACIAKCIKLHINLTMRQLIKHPTVCIACYIIFFFSKTMLHHLTITWQCMRLRLLARLDTTRKSGIRPHSINTGCFWAGTNVNTGQIAQYLLEPFNTGL